MRKKIEIFTDGSCLGNPGPGGYGIILKYHNYIKTLSKGYFFTTNNRMELMSVIIALESLKKSCYVRLTTDSQYVYKGITQWIIHWKKKKWRRLDKLPVLNIDLWKRLDEVNSRHKINWCWIKSHTGHPENETCDRLAKNASILPTEEDINYLNK